MNKHVINSLSEYNFNYEGNYGYGNIAGYEVNVYNNPLSVGPVFYFSTYLSDQKKNDFIIKASAYKSSFVIFDKFNFGVGVQVGAATGGAYEKKFKELLPKILEILEELEAPKSDICPQTGEVLDMVDSKLVTVFEHVKIRLSNKAVLDINEAIKEDNNEFENAPNNYLKGFAGIVIGGIAGVAATVIFSLIGYVTAISSIISVLLGVFLYEKFGGKKNKVMIIMSLLTTLVMILGALIIMYVIVANTACIVMGVDYKGLKAFFYRMEAAEGFKSSFFLDLGLNALFIIIGEAFTISRLVKSVKRPTNLG